VPILGQVNRAGASGNPSLPNLPRMDQTFKLLQTRFPPEVCYVVLAYLHEPVNAIRAGLWPVLLCDASYPLRLHGGYAVWKPQRKAPWN